MPCQDYQAESGRGRTLDRRCARAAAAEMRNWTVGRSATSPAFDPLANSSRNNSGWTWHAEAAEERREEASVKCSGRKRGEAGRRTLLDGSVSFGPHSLAPFRSRSRNSNGFGDLCPPAYHERAACCMQIIIDAVKTLRRAADHTTQQRGERRRWRAFFEDTKPQARW